jgi:hypothetical protein
MSICVSFPPFVSPRNGIAEAMVWCIEHADSGDEVIECLAESLSILEVSRQKPETHRLYKQRNSRKKIENYMYALLCPPTHTTDCFRPLS